MHTMVKFHQPCSWKCCHHSRFGERCSSFFEGIASAHLFNWLSLPPDSHSCRKGIQGAWCECGRLPHHHLLLSGQKQQEEVKSAWSPSSPSPAQMLEATPSTSYPATLQSKLSSSSLPKVPISSPSPAKRSKVEVKAPAPASQFDLTTFLFKQKEIGKKAAKGKEKSESTKKEEKGDLTKPEPKSVPYQSHIKSLYSFSIEGHIYFWYWQQDASKRGALHTHLASNFGTSTAKDIAFDL